MSAPRVSIIIPLKSGREIRYPLAIEPGQELLVVTGQNVSFQRNEGARLAQGDFLYFLDDDCEIGPETLKLALEVMAQGDYAAMGGPSLTHPLADYWEHFFGRILSLRLATLVTQPRNWPIGRTREVGGAELITCNLVVRRSWFEKVGGFNLDLHPSEDVEFVQRLRSRGGKLLYHPGLKVWRHRRTRLDQFLWQYLRYGAARGALVWRTSLPPQAIYLLPLLLVVLAIMGKAWLLKLYLLVCLTGGVQMFWSFGDRTQALLAPPMIALLHLTYGLGVALGLVARPLGISWSGPPRLESVFREPPTPP